MKNYLLFFLCLLLKYSLALGQQSRPNIIIINVDDMGYSDTGFTGSDFYETPHIDQLASMGMQFTNGYASAANCAPSRAGLMTGLWPQRHGIYTVGSSERGKSKDRKIIPTRNTITLDPAFQILPERFQSAGYTTCHAGKWHLSENPLDYGFDLNIGGGHNGHPKSYYPPYKNVAIEHGADEHLTKAVMRHTLQFIDTVANPFFINYSPYAVHTPITAVVDFEDKFRKKNAGKEHNNASYASMIYQLDQGIGQLISLLEQKDLLRQTIIVFTSDNGGLYGITRQKPLRAGKGSYYEGGIRVPMVISWEGKIEARSVNDSPVTNLDLFPTLLSLSGIKTEQEFDGTDLSQTLFKGGPMAERNLYWHFPVYLQAYNPDDNENRDPLFRTRPGSVIRQGKWKLHYYFEDKAIELFDLEHDIGEENDLSTKRADIKNALFTQLQEWWKATDAPLPDDPNPAYISK